MRAMGFRPSEEELAQLLHEVDEDGSGEIEFGQFSKLCIFSRLNNRALYSNKQLFVFLYLDD